MKTIQQVNLGWDWRGGRCEVAFLGSYRFLSAYGGGNGVVLWAEVERPPRFEGRVEPDHINLAVFLMLTTGQEVPPGARYLGTAMVSVRDPVHVYALDTVPMVVQSVDLVRKSFPELPWEPKPERAGALQAKVGDGLLFVYELAVQDTGPRRFTAGYVDAAGTAWISNKSEKQFEPVVAVRAAISGALEIGVALPPDVAGLVN